MSWGTPILSPCYNIEAVLTCLCSQTVYEWAAPHTKLPQDIYEMIR